MYSVCLHKMCPCVPGASLLRSRPAAATPPPLTGVWAGCVGALGPLYDGPAPPGLGLGCSGGVVAGAGVENTGGVTALGPLAGGRAVPGTTSSSDRLSVSNSTLMSMEPGWCGLCFLHQPQGQVPPCLQLMHCQPSSPYASCMTTQSRQQGKLWRP